MPYFLLEIIVEIEVEYFQELECLITLLNISHKLEKLRKLTIPIELGFLE